MSDDITSSTDVSIDNVASPWYSRPRNWLIAGAVAAGVIALGNLRRRGLSTNPLRSKDPKYWLGPLFLGSGPPVPFRESTPRLAGLWAAASQTSQGVGAPGLASDMTEAVLQLFIALGRPSNLPDEAYYTIGSAINNRTGGPQWGPNIVNLTKLFEEAQKDPDLLRWVWYSIHVPSIASLSPQDQIRVFEVIDSLPLKERWRVQWFYSSMPHISRGTHIPGIYGDYHHGYLDQPGPWGLTLEQVISLPYKEFLEKTEGVIPRKELWHEVHEFEPKKPELLDLSTRAVVHFPRKDYLRAYKYLDKETGLQEADRVRAAVGLSFAFGPDWKKWLDGMLAKGFDVHDATFWLPEEPKPGLGEFLKRRFLYPSESRQTSAMILIAEKWNDIPPQIKKATTANIVKYLTSAQYKNVKDETFAEEAARWGVDEDDYHKMEARFLKAVRLARRTKSLIPKVQVSSGGFRLFKLDRSDPRGVFLGRHTSCCQAPGFEGAACAWYGVESPRSGFYVVEDVSGAIIAQSWTWVNGDVLVFDNIEGPGIQSSDTRALVIKMYEELARKILETRNGLLEVRIGDTVDRRSGGRRFIDWPWPRTENLIPPPFDFLNIGEDAYSDATARQFVISVNGAGSKFFKSRQYMSSLAHMLGEAWNNDDSSLRYEDAVVGFTEFINKSPFRVEYKISRQGSPETTPHVNVFRSCFDVSVFLTGNSGKWVENAFDFDICASGSFTDILLRHFSTDIESMSDTERWAVIEALGIEIMPHDVDLEPELPLEEADWREAKYVVSVDDEEFRGYKNRRDAEVVRDIMLAVNEEYIHNSHMVGFYKKLTDEEAEEATENGELEEYCYELVRGGWWVPLE